MKKTIIILAIPLCVLSVGAGKLIAQEETTPRAIPEEEVQEKVKEEFEKLTEEGLEKVKGSFDKTKAYARVGEIQKIENKNLTIKQKNEEIAECNVTDNATILKTLSGKPRTTIEVDDLKKDDFVIAMGFVNQNQFLAKRIIVTDPPSPSPARGFIYGRVKEVDGLKITIQKNGDQEKLTIDSKTNLKIIGKEESAVEDIQLEDKVAAIYGLKNGKIDGVKAMLIIPGKNNPESLENEVQE